MGNTHVYIRLYKLQFQQEFIFLSNEFLYRERCRIFWSGGGGVLGEHIVWCIDISTQLLNTNIFCAHRGHFILIIADIKTFVVMNKIS